MAVAGILMVLGPGPLIATFGTVTPYCTPPASGAAGACAPPEPSPRALAGAM
jgi:hypothetical protein